MSDDKTIGITSDQRGLLVDALNDDQDYDGLRGSPDEVVDRMLARAGIEVVLTPLERLLAEAEALAQTAIHLSGSRRHSSDVAALRTQAGTLLETIRGFHESGGG